MRDAMNVEHLQLRTFADSASPEQLMALSALLPAICSIMARQGTGKSSTSIRMGTTRILIEIDLSAEPTATRTSGSSQSDEPKPDRPAKRMGPMSAAEKATIRDMFAEGASAADIAASLCRATPTIALALHRLKATSAAVPGGQPEASAAGEQPGSDAAAAPTAMDVFRAACAEVKAEHSGPVVDHLRARHFKGGWDDAMDLQLLEMSIERVGLDVITMELGRTAKEARTRLDYLLKDRTFTAADVVSELRAMGAANA